VTWLIETSSRRRLSLITYFQNMNMAYYLWISLMSIYKYIYLDMHTYRTGRSKLLYYTYISHIQSSVAQIISNHRRATWPLRMTWQIELPVKLLDYFLRSNTYEVIGASQTNQLCYPQRRPIIFHLSPWWSQWSTIWNQQWAHDVYGFWPGYFCWYSVQSWMLCNHVCWCGCCA